jgi:hypothetical protein
VRVANRLDVEAVGVALQSSRQGAREAVDGGGHGRVGHRSNVAGPKDGRSVFVTVGPADGDGHAVARPPQARELIRTVTN